MGNRVKEGNGVTSCNTNLEESSTGPKCYRDRDPRRDCTDRYITFRPNLDVYEFLREIQGNGFSYGATITFIHDTLHELVRYCKQIEDDLGLTSSGAMADKIAFLMFMGHMHIKNLMAEKDAETQH